MVITLTNIRAAYKTTAEAAYAAGKGAATKYLATPMAAGDVADMTVCNMIKSLEIGMPTADREVKQAASQGADDKLVFTKGYKYGEFKIEQYIQNATWATLASAALTPGTIQASYLFHFEVPGVDGALDYFDLVGCVLKEYEIVQPTDGDFPTELLTFTYYDMVNGSAITNLGALAVTAPETHNSIGLTLDGDVITDVISLNCKITINQLDKKVATKYQRMDPVPISRSVEIDATFLTDTAALFGDELAIGGTPTAINLIAAIVKYRANPNTITFAKMFVSESNIGKIAGEQEVYEYNLKLLSGTGNTVTHG